MYISRRQFIKTIAAGTFTVAMGNGVSDILLPSSPAVSSVTEPENYIKVLDDLWKINTKEKTISYIGGEKNASFNLLDMYRTVMDAFDERDMMDLKSPMSRFTDQIFNMEDGWRITDETFGFLSGGSVVDKERGNLWSCIEVLGEVPKDTTIGIIQGNKAAAVGKAGPGPLPFSAIVRTKKDGELIEGGEVIIRARNAQGPGLYYLPYEFKVQAHLGISVAPVSMQLDYDIPPASITRRAKEILLGALKKPTFKEKKGPFKRSIDI